MAEKLDKIKRAKEYIDQLALGIDPLTGELAEKTDVINQLPVSRCLYFVSQILSEAAAELESPAEVPTKSKKPEKLPFALPADQRDKFRYSKLPLSASEIVRRLNELVDTQKMKGISYRQVAGWLVDAGLLTERVSEQGHVMKRPSEQGVKCGITVEHRFGQNGPYTVVVYDEDAQQLVLDNLDAILAFEPPVTKKPKEKHPVSNGHAQVSSTEAEITAAMKRTEQGIRRELLRRNLDITVD